MDETGGSAESDRGSPPGNAAAVVGPDGRLTAWSPGARRLLGHRPEQALGLPAGDLLAAPPPAAALRALARGTEWHGRLALLHRDGRPVTADLRATPLHTATGTAWTVTAEPAVAPDPDAAAEPATTGHRELREWAFSQLPIAVGVYDRETRLVGANDEVLRMMGEGGEPVGLLMAETADRWSGLPHARLAALMNRVLAGGETVRADHLFRTPGEAGAHAWTTVLYPLKGPDGGVRGVAVGGLDTTDEYRARRRLAVVNAAGLRIGTTLDVTRTAQELADVATEDFADFTSVDLLDSVFLGTEAATRPTGGPAVFRRAAEQSVLIGCPESAVPPGQTDHLPADSPMTRALATGRPSRHRVDDPDVRRWLTVDPVRAQRIAESGTHSLIVAPLLARGTTLGITLFARHRTEEDFDADDVLLAEELTARAALSIDNARRYTFERNTALALQRSMMPHRAPRQAAVEIASRYLPAGPQAGVGGDWFDVIPLSGARVALVVGDVVGHGIQATATMGRLRTAVRTLADVDVPPDELLTHLDDLVLRLDREADPRTADEDGREAADIGATCLYAVYDPVSRRCTLARAGHPGPAVVRPDGRVEFPELPAGPPLGLGGLPFEAAELDLPEGSVLALFTDGLVEAVDHDVDHGIERLARALAAGGISLEETCDEILRLLLPEAPEDDIALLLARTRALDTSQVAAWDVPPDPAVVSHARKLAAEQLAVWGLDEYAFVTELVVSELVTNAIRYGRPPIELRLIHDTSLICEVSDTSSTAPHLRRARTFDEGGRGLLLVAQLTQGWGTRHTPFGKTIWTEQTLPEV
ncbi:SpoIIE family protein phosphatase [Kitasatospora sp. NPDC007106]|uniref:ATP-binding SpoIIE family protein phosphatase n=1 Tax=Kitasatospora sp. NPDC007106 TaxID=3156914 RepID=UPI0033C861F8